MTSSNVIYIFINGIPDVVIYYELQHEWIKGVSGWFSFKIPNIATA